MQFDPDQLDPNQIDLDQVFSVNAASGPASDCTMTDEVINDVMSSVGNNSFNGFFHRAIRKGPLSS